MRFLILAVVFALLAVSSGAQERAADESSRLAELLGAEDSEGFAKVIEPRPFVFPADHGPHEAFRNEWWYFTGNLDGSDGRRFGYELTIFRFSLSPEAPENDSEWRSRQVFIAHFAITDADRERFMAADKSARGALGLAGATAEPLRVWIDDWEIKSIRDGVWSLKARDAEFALELELEAQKPPVLNGTDGLSQKSAEPGNASYYYSMTRWQTRGTLRINKETHSVSGLSWLDREWSSSALASDQQGWDWFALQLADNTELMFYSLRKRDGSQDAQSAGTWVAADGVASSLDREQVRVEVRDYWDSPRGGRYPSAWQISIPQRGLLLNVTPVMADQELTTIVRYWEGAVDVSGTRNGEAISGRGYVELTGYATE